MEVDKPEEEPEKTTAPEEEKKPEVPEIAVPEIKEEKLPETPVEEKMEIQATKKEIPATKKVEQLSDKERGACDVLLQMRSPDLLSPPVKQESNDQESTRRPSFTSPELRSPSEIAEGLRRPSVAAEQVVGGPETPKEVPESVLEKDAVLALLQMHEPVHVPNGYVPPAEQKVQVQEDFKAAEATRASDAMAAEHNYFQKPADTVESDRTDSASEGEQDLVPTLPPQIQIDHNYCVSFFPEDSMNKKVRKDDKKKSESSLDEIINAVIARSQEEQKNKDFLAPEPPVETKPKKQPRQRKDSTRKTPNKKLKDVTNLKKEVITPPKPKPTFKTRELQEEMQVLYDFLINGIDEEDSNFLKRRYDEMLGEDDMQTYWLNDTHWVDHTHTLIPDPPKKKKKQEPLTKHVTGMIHSMSLCSLNYLPFLCLPS